MPMKVTYTTLDGEIVSETRNGVVSDYIPDPLGSTAKLVNTSMQVTDTYAYWPYGEVRTHTGSSVTPFTFVGTLGYYSDQWGGVYVRAREFVPSKTQWMSRDPLWPSELAFVYGANDPITRSDPLRLCSAGCTVEASDAAKCAKTCASRGQIILGVQCTLWFRCLCLYSCECRVKTPFDLCYLAYLAACKALGGKIGTCIAEALSFCSKYR
jgi:RHS repeat-associated protein